jgi:hypothetical protein
MHRFPEAVSNLARVVHTMAIHRRSRRYNRAPPLHPRRDPPKRSFYVRSPQISRRLRIYISVSVSKTRIPNLNPKANAKCQSHNFLPNPHLIPPRSPEQQRHNPRRRQTNNLDASRASLRPSRMQRILSPTFHGSREHKLRYSGRLDARE